MHPAHSWRQHPPLRQVHARDSCQVCSTCVLASTSSRTDLPGEDLGDGSRHSGTGTLAERAARAAQLAALEALLKGLDARAWPAVWQPRFGQHECARHKTPARLTTRSAVRSAPDCPHASRDAQPLQQHTMPACCGNGWQCRWLHQSHAGQPHSRLVTAPHRASASGRGRRARGKRTDADTRRNQLRTICRPGGAHGRWHRPHAGQARRQVLQALQGGLLRCARPLRCAARLQQRFERSQAVLAMSR
jgi:hypothetical protein